MEHFVSLEHNLEEKAARTRVGFTNPTVDNPFASLSSLIRVRIAAKAGAEAEVPPINVGDPSPNIKTIVEAKLVSHFFGKRSCL